jgi:hypothetical protein
LGHVVKCIGDHICLLDDLPNGATLAQEIVAGSILSIIKILAIKNDKLYSTFLHVAFGSQSLLKSTSDQTDSDTNWRTEEGDQMRGEWEPIKIPHINFGLYPIINLIPISSTSVKTD